MKKEKILLGMSGGVDSAFSSYLLKEQGYDVYGAYLLVHDYADPHDAVVAAKQTDIPLIINDCKEEFEKNVIEDFIFEYTHGRTPNPCVVCNRTLKIQKLIEIAKQNNIEHIATGHYAKIKYDMHTGRYYPSVATDTKKDQSYVLWRLTQEQLSVLKTPLSDMTKTEVKKYAESLNITASKNAESQEICFVPNNDYVGFIKDRIKNKEMDNGNDKICESGNFIDADGKILGTHKGIIHYTIGQKRGLGIALGTQKVVTEINAENNTVTLGNSGDEYKTRLVMDNLNFCMSIPENLTNYTGALFAKIRYAAKPVKVQAAIHRKQNDNSVFAEVIFSEPVKSITPGQSCVIYTPDINDVPSVAFGGIIL